MSQRVFQQFINGAFRNGAKDRWFSAMNPYTGKSWATVARAEVEDVEAAVAAARDAFDNVWSRYTGLQRAKLMHRLADLLERDAHAMAVLESTDNGKVIRETQAQMLFAARAYRFFAGAADKLRGSQIPLDNGEIFDVTYREPLGVVALITAWNSPMGLLANKLAPALAAGNCVVIKPSEHASATTVEFCRLIKEAGFPSGVVNVVCGDGEVGNALVTAGVNKVSFTGSAAVGRRVAAQAGQHLTPVLLELGGKSPNIVFEDADFDKAIVGALAGIFAATGQSCVAGSRLLVHESMHAKMVHQLAERATSIKLGDPLDASTEMGTVANEMQLERVLASIQMAQQEGAKLVVGGQRATGPGLSDGLFIEPTIFDGVSNTMQIAREEVFGPVLCVIPFKSETEALEIANDTPYGLAAGIWTQDLSRVMRLSKALQVGQLWVNTYRSLAVQAPFGGVKESGFGREKGLEALDEYLTSKNVMIDYSNDARDPFAMKA